jgi:hypothetical protein
MKMLVFSSGKFQKKTELNRKSEPPDKTIASLDHRSIYTKQVLTCVNRFSVEQSKQSGTGQGVAKQSRLTSRGLNNRTAS